MVNNLSDAKVVMLEQADTIKLLRSKISELVVAQNSTSNNKHPVRCSMYKMHGTLTCMVGFKNKCGKLPCMVAQHHVS